MIRAPRKRQLSLLLLTMSVFFVVCGGPYGLETAVSGSGAGMAIILILITPLIWSVPAALMTAELTSALPREGGYYVWVKEAFGPFAGFLCGWWSWIYFCFDLALYPGLFVGYWIAFASQVPQLAGVIPHSDLGKFLMGLAMMVPFTWVNVRGARPTGESNLGLAVILLSPFVILVIVSIIQLSAHPVNVMQPMTAPGKGLGAAFAGGIVVVMWNFLGWDSLSTVAEETEAPTRTFPKAMFWSLPLVSLTYLLPVLAGLAIVRDPSKWTDSSWPSIARVVGGPWMGLAIGFVALISSLGLYNATLLAASRLPFVLARDGLMPGFATRIHRRYGTPWVAILASAAVAAVLTLKTFATLVAVDVFVYSAGLLLELAALVALRARRPQLHRHYRIPGGLPTVTVLAILPAVLIGTAVAAQFLKDRASIWITLASLASGPVVYWALRLALRPRPALEHELLS